MEAHIKWTDYRRQAPWFGPAIIAFEYLIIAIVFYLAERLSLAWWPLWALVLGHSQWTLSDNIGHYATHFTLLAKKWLNKNLECLYFFPVFTTWKEWRDIHERHHRFVGDAEKDPQVATFERWGLRKDKDTFWRCLLLSPVADFNKNLVGLWIFRNLGMTLFWIAVLAILAVLSHAGHNYWPILGLWMISYFTTRVWIMFFSEAAEHWAEEEEPQVTGTRNLKGYFFAAYKRHNDQFHKLHHKYPGVPADQLGKFHRALTGEDPNNSLIKLHGLAEVLREWRMKFRSM